MGEVRDWTTECVTLDLRETSALPRQRADARFVALQPSRRFPASRRTGASLGYSLFGRDTLMRDQRRTSDIVQATVDHPSTFCRQTTWGLRMSSAAQPSGIGKKAAAFHLSLAGAAACGAHESPPSTLVTEGLGRDIKGRRKTKATDGAPIQYKLCNMNYTIF